VIHGKAISNIFAAVRAMIIVVLQDAYPLFGGEGVDSISLKGVSLGVSSKNVVLVPLVTCGTHLAAVFQRFICDTASFAWSCVLRSWLVVAAAGNSFVARATHLLYEAPVARFAGPANNTWAFVLLFRIRQATLAPLRLAIAVTAHVFLVVTGLIFVSANDAWSRKSFRWHSYPLSDGLPSTVCAHSIALNTMNVKFEPEV
jgi:hypothetical protein